MNKDIIVLSLFDGNSGGQIALKEQGIKVKMYYSSEIDKFAIAQTQLNFPDTIQLGNIENWRKWDIDWSKINLILAGSPCQGFSFAGKQLNFNDERSKLFFVFVDILNHCKKLNPDIKFLLENVIMKKEYQRVINNILGLFPVRINSNRVSAQNRDRLYWTNIRVKMVGLFNEIHSDIPQPKDRGILLKDILQPESEIDEKYYLKNPKFVIRDSEKRTDVSINPVKAHCLRINEGRQRGSFIKIDKKGNKKADQNKSGCLTAGGHSGGNHSDMDIIAIGAVKFGRTDEAKEIRRQNMKKGRDYNPFAKKEISGIDFEKMGALMTGTNKDNLLTDGIKFRRLTPLECARLQTVPSWYKWDCSDTQQYKMLGNGWTIEVIKHILSFLNINHKK